MDDFSLTPQSTPVDRTLTIGNVQLVEGNAGVTTFSFLVTLSGPAGAAGVSFDIATSDGSATIVDNDYVSRSLTGVVIPAISQSYQFDVTVNGDSTSSRTKRSRSRSAT